MKKEQEQSETMKERIEWEKEGKMGQEEKRQKRYSERTKG